MENIKLKISIWLAVLSLSNFSVTAASADVEQVHNDKTTTTFNNSLSPSGDKLYFTQVASDFSGIGIYQGDIVNGKVTSVAPVMIDGIALQGTDVHISPDGSKLLYSARSAFNTNDELGDYNLYISEKKASEWAQPKALPKTINSSADEFYPSLTNNGDIYFSRRIEGDNLDVFVSRFDQGEYIEAERLGSEVNTGILEGDSFIAPDESYLVFARMKGDDSMGMTDLYISYQTPEGWLAARHLGESINSKGIDGSPFISRDGHWLYFTSNREGPEPEKFDSHLGLYRTPFNLAQNVQQESR